MRRFFLFLICLASSGCFPVIESIYQPKAPGGKLLETSCGYNQGPGRWDKIELALQDVKVQVRTTEFNRQLITSLEFLVPEGVTLQLMSQNFVLHDGNETKLIASGDVSYYESTKIDSIVEHKQKATDPLLGKTYNGRWQRYNERYILDVVMPPQDVRHDFGLELPEVEINGKRSSFPIIIFKPSKELYFYGYCK